MTLKLTCTECGKAVRVPETDAGLRAVCPACGNSFVVPGQRVDDAATAGAAGQPAARDVDRIEGDWGQHDYAEYGTARLPGAARGGSGAVSWAVIGTAACVAVFLISLAVMAQRNGQRDKQSFASTAPATGPSAPTTVDRAPLVALKNDAEALAVDGKLEEAHRKYQQFARAATALGAALENDPALKELVAQAKSDAEQIHEMLLARASEGGGDAGDNEAGPTEPTTPTTKVATTERPTPGPPPPPETKTETEPAVAAPPEPLPVVSDSGEGEVPPPSGQTGRKAVASTRPPLQADPEPVVGVSDEQIGQAIQRGVDFLIPQFDPETHQIRGVWLRGEGDDKAHGCGVNALVAYALMQCGQAIPDQRLDVRGQFIKDLIEGMKEYPAEPGHPQTYARGLRATALALYARPQDKKALQADVLYLLQTHNKGGYTYAGKRQSYGYGGTGGWDNSNSQYGLLGVWSGADTGLVEIPRRYWDTVEKHWAENQCPNGQWAYGAGLKGGGTLSMTAAGTASMFVTQEYLDVIRHGTRVGREPFSDPLKLALAWFERGDNSVNLKDIAWWGYTLYGIERVGLASGFKYFGTHDWYRELARHVIARQQGNGSWGDVIETSYALLFLARGRHPILMNKLRFEGYWSNRPRDAANLARFAGKQLERQLNWQVVSLEKDWNDWLDSPILYIASHLDPKFSDEDCQKLRKYAEAGGLIFTHCDGNDREFDEFAAALAKRLFPRYEMKEVPQSHPVYTVLYKVEPRPRLTMVHNGSRILMLHSPSDIAKRWQTCDNGTGTYGGLPLHHLGVNLFIYASGKRELRNRLQSTHVTQPGPAPHGDVAVARLQYSGNWDPEPAAWPRFSRVFQRTTGTGLQVKTVKWADLRPDTAPIAHVTGTASYRPTPGEVFALKSYVEAGGVLLVDACGSKPAFVEDVEGVLARAFPSAPPQVVRGDHPLLSAGPPGMADLSKPKLRPYVVDRFGGAMSGTFDVVAAGKGHVILSRLDLTSGLLGTSTWGIAGYDPGYAQAFVQNAIFWTMDGQVGP